MHASVKGTVGNSTMVSKDSDTEGFKQMFLNKFLLRNKRQETRNAQVEIETTLIEIFTV